MKKLASTLLASMFLLAPAAIAEPQQIPEKADKEAWMLLKKAHDSRQVLPKDFEGFDAKLFYTVNGKKYAGTIEFRNRRGGTTIDIDMPKSELGWMKDKLLSMIGHRRGGDFAKQDGRYNITFAKKNKENRLGKLVVLHDKLNSSYRVKDNKVLEVTREMGNTSFTIAVMQSMTADPGKYLAHHFTVTYRDKTTNSIKRVDGYRDKYKKLDGVWLPIRRNVLTIKPAVKTPELRKIELKEVKVLKKTKS